MRSATPLKKIISVLPVLMIQLGAAVSWTELSGPDSVGRGSRNEVNLYVGIERVPPLMIRLSYRRCQGVYMRYLIEGLRTVR